MRVAVVGGGIYGQIITWRLALRGVHVTQFEPIGPGNTLSASGDKSRIVRGLYGNPAFAATGLASLPLWRSWGDELGTPMVDLRGVLYLEHASRGRADDEFRAYVDGGITNLIDSGTPIEVLAPEEIVKRHPGIAIDGLVRGVFEPGGGFGWVSKATRAIALAATKTSRVEHVGHAASRIVVEGGTARGVEWTDAHGAHLVSADHVVVAAALGGVPLVERIVDASLGIRAIPHFVSYWDVPWPEGRLLSRELLPPFAELGTGLYGFPDDGENGFKVAWHEPLRQPEGVEPDEATWHEPPPVADVMRLRADATKRFPGLARASLRGTYQCRYDATSDENFQVGPVPGVSGLTFVGGMSGHGFKHAPVIGESVARSIVAEASIADLSSFAVRLAPRA